ncbi:MAG: AMP-binding protein [Bauldia sp.]|uniref:class I adenylate-forming enzyme family protein n=1 Tax=Bauldia sp. TaxID=2575872 RepID=UPI001D3014EA|nr:AMP-binding protein [Bauldia sp.]MCB1497235.1 AMP-binding protein [Bauldia sp.]
MRVEQFLRDSARRLPDKVAVVAGRDRLSYGDLDRMSDRLAAGMLGRGVSRGDRVVIFTDNCWEAVVSIFAVLKAGATFVPVNPSTKAEKLAFILENCRATAIVTQGRLATIAARAMIAAPSVDFVVLIGGKGPATAGSLGFEETVAGDHMPALPPPGITLDLAMLVYTSGSTGFPKGVMMTHQNVVAAAGSITTYLDSREEDVILNLLPISFDYGLYQVLMTAMVGATLVLEKSFAYPQAILNRMSEEKVTGLPLVPTMAAILLQMRDLAPGSFPHLRYLTNTAAALPPTHIMQLQVLFPFTRIYSMYGLTECKRCTYLPPEDLAEHPDSVGIAIPGTEAYVADEEGRPVAPGIVGELHIRGPHVMRGYWENPDATDRALRPGPYPWEKVLRTGDFFRADEEGFLYFIGRRDDIIKTRGEKVAPKEVETALYGLAGIAEAAVVGVPDPVLGHAIKAVVALSPGSQITEKDVLRHCAANLEDFMVPKMVEFRDSLPKTDSGKISRRLIEEEVMEAAE